ncbi:MAG TPA: PAS domain-containing protein, partial [Bryobacteraceae bacterium]
MSTPTGHNPIPKEEIERLRARVAELETQLRASSSPQIHAAEEAVHQQKDWLRVTLTSIGDAVLATDTAGKITFLNPVATRLTGWAPEEALGRPVRDVFRIVDETTHCEAGDIVGEVLREGCIVALVNHTALLARDGREIPIEDSAAPIRDLAGN